MTKELSLSAIVVSFNNEEQLGRCLSTLYGQAVDTESELIVVRAGEPSSALKHSYPQIKWIQAPAGTTVPMMRTLAIQAALGDIVALTEDDCVVAPDYCAALKTAHHIQCDAIGGAVQPGSFDKALDWGVFFCEYGRFMPPLTGDVKALPGNNLSYKKHVLIELLEKGDIADGFYEAFVNSGLSGAGRQLKADSTILVRNENRWHMQNVTSIPFHHGRSFAAMRFAKTATWQRLAYLCISFGLPAIQTYRVAREVKQRQQYAPRLLAALPSIILFWSSWSAGEFMGYLLGPGESLKQWR